MRSTRSSIASVAAKILAACGLAAELAASPAAATFTKITTGDIVTVPAWYWNGSWGDYDDDGWLDLFVGSTFASTTNYLYHNNHDGTFTLIDQAAMPKSPSNQHGSAWGDYDNDGNLDLFVTAGNPETTHNMLYHNEGGGTFSWITDGPIYTQTRVGGFHAPSWGDYDNDGFLDLFIAGHDSRNRLFHNEGNGSFTRVLDSAVVLDSGFSECRAFVDYDNDGDIDLFVGNAAPWLNFLYRNDGHGEFTSVTDSGLSNVADTVACSWADYDNDGWLDLFLANVQQNSLYHNEGDGTFTSIEDSAIVQDTPPPDAAFTSVAWGDYDNDGFVDLFVSTGNCWDGQNCDQNQPFHNFLYHNEGDGTFTKVTDGIVVNDPTTQCPGSGFGDYDNDGFLDLFVSQGSFAPTPQTNLLYHNDGNANAWLDVKLVGTRSNRSGIGAKVRVRTFYRGASRWQVREISGGDSESNQQSLNAEFGLADATNIDTLRVEWPSGAVQELRNEAPRQSLTVTEPACMGDAKVSLTIGKLNTPPGDDTLHLKGTLTLSSPSNPPLDPLANGVGLVINGLYVAIPGGAFSGPPGKGWRVNRTATKWTYQDRTATPTGGIYKLVIQESANTPGAVTLSVRGRRGSYAVAPADPHARVWIALAPAVGQCGSASFTSCVFNGSGRTLKCK